MFYGIAGILQSIGTDRIQHERIAIDERSGRIMSFLPVIFNWRLHSVQFRSFHDESNRKLKAHVHSSLCRGGSNVTTDGDSGSGR